MKLFILVNQIYITFIYEPTNSKTLKIVFKFIKIVFYGQNSIFKELHLPLAGLSSVALSDFDTATFISNISSSCSMDKPFW
jgi:hypothetical protein